MHFGGFFWGSVMSSPVVHNRLYLLLKILSVITSMFFMYICILHAIYVYYLRSKSNKM